MTDPYTSEEETNALLVADTRTPEQKKQAALRERNWENEQGVEPQQEPVTWGVDWGRAGQSPCVSIIKRLFDGRIEVVAVEYGPQRTWVGLTDEEIILIVAECASSHQHTDIHFARAIEAKLKEKNT